MTTIIQPDRRLQLVFLKAHLRCLAAGMHNSQYFGRQILDMAARATGKAYKRGQYQQAVNDIIAILAA